LAALDAQAERVRNDASAEGSETEPPEDDGDGRVTSQAGAEADAGPGTAGDEASTGETSTGETSTGETSTGEAGPEG
jgi:hypothetical protein